MTVELTDKELLEDIRRSPRGQELVAERQEALLGDRKLWATEMEKLTTAHDTGRIVNPVGHQGQIAGGSIMGVGYGLMEELKSEDGRVTTLSFADYKIPNIADIPDFETVILQKEGTGVGPFNIKAIGESPNAPTAPAIANAVEDAVGVRIRDLPVTAERVYQALEARG